MASPQKDLLADPLKMASATRPAHSELNWHWVPAVVRNLGRMVLAMAQQACPCVVSVSSNGRRGCSRFAMVIPQK